MRNRERGTGAESLIEAIRVASYREDTVIVVGFVKEVLPLEIELPRYGLTVGGNGVVVNPELLEHEKDVQIRVGNELQTITHYYPSQIEVGTDVVVAVDVKQGVSYVLCKAVPLVD